MALHSFYNRVAQLQGSSENYSSVVGHKTLLSSHTQSLHRLTYNTSLYICTTHSNLLLLTRFLSFLTPLLPSAPPLLLCFSLFLVLHRTRKKVKALLSVIIHVISLNLHRERRYKLSRKRSYGVSLSGRFTLLLKVFLRVPRQGNGENMVMSRSWKSFCNFVLRAVFFRSPITGA